MINTPSNKGPEGFDSVNNYCQMPNWFETMEEYQSYVEKQIDDLVNRFQCDKRVAFIYKDHALKTAERWYRLSEDKRPWFIRDFDNELNQVWTASSLNFAKMTDKFWKAVNDSSYS